MDDDVERVFPEIRLDALHHAVDAEVAGLLVSFVRSNVFGSVSEGVERRIERVNLLELEELSVGQLPGCVHLSALEEVHEDVERGRPGPDRHSRAGLGERLGDGKSKSSIVSYAGNESAFAGQVDVEHLLDIAVAGVIYKGVRVLHSVEE